MEELCPPPRRVFAPMAPPPVFNTSYTPLTPPHCHEPLGPRDMTTRRLASERQTRKLL